MPFKLKNLPYRTSKPRTNGMTFALDKGFSIRECEDFCQVASELVDVVKLGWGTSVVTQNLEEKLKYMPTPVFLSILEVRYLKPIC